MIPLEPSVVLRVGQDAGADGVVGAGGQLAQSEEEAVEQAPAAMCRE